MRTNRPKLKICWAQERDFPALGTKRGCGQALSAVIDRGQLLPLSPRLSLSANRLRRTLRPNKDCISLLAADVADSRASATAAPPVGGWQMLVENMWRRSRSETRWLAMNGAACVLNLSDFNSSDIFRAGQSISSAYLNHRERDIDLHVEHLDSDSPSDFECAWY